MGTPLGKWGPPVWQTIFWGFIFKASYKRSGPLAQKNLAGLMYITVGVAAVAKIAMYSEFGLKDGYWIVPFHTFVNRYR